jgi:hypothetical protein
VPVRVVYVSRIPRASERCPCAGAASVERAPGAGRVGWPHGGLESHLEACLVKRAPVFVWRGVRF